jgi:polysaccharide biosynthesis protein PslH
MKSLKILLVMIEPPLPFGNAAARWFYVLVKGLVERGHKVTVFAACSNPEDISKAKSLFPDPEYDLRCYGFANQTGISGKIKTLLQPYSYMFSSRLKQDLAVELSQPFDILHLEQLWSGWLGQHHVLRALLNVHHLIWIDQQFVKPTTIQQTIERYLAVSTEKRLLRKYRYIRSCSPRLSPEIVKENSKAEIINIPVGIDLSQYEFIPESQRTHEKMISVIGSMGWYPSFSAAKRLITQLWASIKQQVPEAKLQIVGWSARSTLQEYINLPDISILENVPDTQPYFEQTSVFLYAPSRGSGMKIKILEAMAWGVPIVTTSEGVEGLNAEDGIHAGISDSDNGLIERAVSLLQDMSAQNRLRTNARLLIEKQCSPKVTLDAIENTYRTMLTESSHA